jgi:hypothetical protein
MWFFDHGPVLGKLCLNSLRSGAAGVTPRSRGIAYPGDGFPLTFPGIETLFTMPASRNVQADAIGYAI